MTTKILFFQTNPNDLLPPPTEKPRKKHVKNKKKKKQKQTTKNENFKNKLRILKNLSLEKPITYDAAFGENLDEDNDFNETRREHWDYGKNVSYNEEKSKIRKSNKQKWNDLRELSPPPITAENSFCESPNKEFMHFVIKRVNRQINESLFEVNALWAMCELEQTIISTNKYENLCQKELSSDNCCRPWSLANYVALLSNKTSCFDISVSQLLRTIFSWQISNDSFIHFFSGWRCSECQKLIVWMLPVL